MMKSTGWIEYESPEKVEYYQTIYLRSAIEYAKKKSEYYTRVFKDSGLSTLEIENTADIKKIPLTDKKELQQKNEAFFCCKPKEIADIIHTSGSVGSRPIVNPLTKLDLKRLAYNEELSFLCAGVKKSDVFMISTVLDGFFVAGLAYYIGLKRLGACVIRVAPLDFKKQLSILKKVKATGIVGVPSNLIKFANYCIDKGVSTESLEISKLILIGESIRNHDLSLNALGCKLKSCWPEALLLSTYGNTEIATSFCECSHGIGGHSHPDLCMVEIVDDSGKSLEDGEIGELVVTTFASQGMPLIRYRTGDITFINRDKCSCGRTSPRIGPILARRENMLKVRGVTIYPSAIEEGIMEVEGVTDYVIIAYRGASDSDEVKILVSTGGEDKYLINRVAEKVRAKSRITPKVEVIKEAELKKLQYQKGTSKAKKFFDNRRVLML